MHRYIQHACTRIHAAWMHQAYLRIHTQADRQRGGHRARAQGNKRLGRGRWGANKLGRVPNSRGRFAFCALAGASVLSCVRVCVCVSVGMRARRARARAERRLKRQGTKRDLFETVGPIDAVPLLARLNAEPVRRAHPASRLAVSACPLALPSRDSASARMRPQHLSTWPCNCTMTPSLPGRTRSLTLLLTG